MRPISCYIATITHAQNMQAGQSWSITYVTLICGSARGEAIGDDTLFSWTMAWADWSSDGSQIGRFQWTATERDRMFIPPDHNYETTFRLPGLWALRETCPLSKTLPQRVEECHDVSSELSSFQTSKWDHKRDGCNTSISGSVFFVCHG